MDLLVAHRANLNIKDRGGWTPLHYAALNKDFAIIKNLIKSGGLSIISVALIFLGAGA